MRETFTLHQLQRFTLELGGKTATTLRHAILSSPGIIRAVPSAHHSWGTPGGIGFTMSIFLARLALPDRLLDAGKLGTLTGSLLSMIAGSLVLALVSARPARKKSISSEAA
ncbi:MAG TPA: Na+/H+ antiporter NhaA [Planctomicrobium sp.]|nr:Na+/H+ antiporter NhaA [Planctomicrobium sp.]